jgi:hypothetical protein
MCADAYGKACGKQYRLVGKANPCMPEFAGTDHRRHQLMQFSVAPTTHGSAEPSVLDRRFLWQQIDNVPLTPPPTLWGCKKDHY